MTLRFAAFNTGPDYHLLDHIAPLACLLQMPLITTEARNDQLARKFYPQVESRNIFDLEFKLHEIAEEFDALFECKYWAPHLKTLFKNLYKKDMRLIFCPHGQSDKGFQVPLLAPYATQDIVLIYGQLLKNMLQELGIWDSILHPIFIGNYRFAFYQKHRAFYDDLAEREIFSKLDPRKKNLLYAPTWCDADQASSFFEMSCKILSQIPSTWNLLVKVHPLLEQRDPAHFYSIASLIDKTPNALLIDEFPPVYPILSRVDAYLGDFSSVGYDFLTFQKPMFFLPSKQPARLRSCGELFDPLKLSDNSYAEKQKALYSLAFGDSFADIEKLKQSIK